MVKACLVFDPWGYWTWLLCEETFVSKSSFLNLQTFWNMPLYFRFTDGCISLWCNAWSWTTLSISLCLVIGIMWIIVCRNVTRFHVLCSIFLSVTFYRTERTSANLSYWKMRFIVLRTLFPNPIYSLRQLDIYFPCVCTHVKKLTMAL